MLAQPHAPPVPMLVYLPLPTRHARTRIVRPRYVPSEWIGQHGSPRTGEISGGLMGTRAISSVECRTLLTVARCCDNISGIRVHQRVDIIFLIGRCCLCCVGIWLRVPIIVASITSRG